MTSYLEVVMKRLIAERSGSQDDSTTETTIPLRALGEVFQADLVTVPLNIRIFHDSFKARMTLEETYIDLKNEPKPKILQFNDLDDAEMACYWDVTSGALYLLEARNNTTLVYRFHDRYKNALSSIYNALFFQAAERNPSFERAVSLYNKIAERSSPYASQATRNYLNKNCFQKNAMPAAYALMHRQMSSLEAATTPFSLPDMSQIEMKVLDGDVIDITVMKASAINPEQLISLQYSMASGAISFDVNREEEDQNTLNWDVNKFSFERLFAYASYQNAFSGDMQFSFSLIDQLPSACRPPAESTSTHPSLSVGRSDGQAYYRQDPQAQVTNLSEDDIMQSVKSWLNSVAPEFLTKTPLSDNKKESEGVTVSIDHNASFDLEGVPIRVSVFKFKDSIARSSNQLLDNIDKADTFLFGQSSELRKIDTSIHYLKGSDLFIKLNNSKYTGHLDISLIQTPKELQSVYVAQAFDQEVFSNDPHGKLVNEMFRFFQQSNTMPPIDYMLQNNKAYLMSHIVREARIQLGLVPEYINEVNLTQRIHSDPEFKKNRYVNALIQRLHWVHNGNTIHINLEPSNAQMTYDIDDGDLNGDDSCRKLFNSQGGRRLGELLNIHHVLTGEASGKVSDIGIEPIKDISKDGLMSFSS